MKADIADGSEMPKSGDKHSQQGRPLFAPLVGARKGHLNAERLGGLELITSSYFLPADDRSIDAVVASLTLMYVIDRAAA
jgi:hypothetical protein